MPRVPYAPESFPVQLGPRFTTRRVEEFSWAELAHSAITVGRRNWSDVLQHGTYSVLEILWRIAMLRANLRTGDARRLVPTSAYRRLDKSEKGAVSFFIGLCMAKAFASRLLQVPWLLHLSTYQSVLNPSFVTTNRPDFVGFDSSGRTVVIEAKGRTGGAPNTLMARAKEQTAAISAVSGVAPTARIAMASCFSIRGLRVRIADPQEDNPHAATIDEPIADLARAYYLPLFDVARALNGPKDILDRSISLDLPGMDLTLSFSEDIVSWYTAGQPSWEEITHRRMESGTLLAMEVASRTAEPSTRPLPLPTEEKQREQNESIAEFLGKDGVGVRLGTSWSADLMEREPEHRG